MNNYINLSDSQGYKIINIFFLKYTFQANKNNLFRKI